ncbi:MAG: YggS family pyridoxal phosphate-dependent enzyme [Deltaproteobacteria bacterium]|nr:YggS family pyridoxal phosphate-dependent enzyme [Deltaproteobacteria bacterium]
MIAENFAEIFMKIERAAARGGRSRDEVRIVAAAKGQGREKIEEALSAGVTIIGHNYLQEASREMPRQIPPEVEIHMIGHLQKNKAGKAVEIFHVIETVDSVDLAAALARRAEALGRNIGVMIQVNLAHEAQKSGIKEEMVPELIGAILRFPWLRLLGLMTMPPFFDQPEKARFFFARLRDLRERLMASGVLASDMKELSMGMTGDFDVAVEEGATLVRVGTALFGPRHNAND